MNLDPELFAALLDGANFDEALAAGLTEFHIASPEALRIWKWMTQYYERHGVAPTHELFHQMYPAFKLSKDPLPLAETLDLMHKELRNSLMTEMMQEVGALVSDNDAEDAVADGIRATKKWMEKIDALETVSKGGAANPALTEINWRESTLIDTSVKYRQYPFIVESAITLVVAPPKSFKSLLMVGLAIATVTGDPYLWQEETDPLTAMYLHFEEGDTSVERRMKDMGISNDREYLGALHYLSSNALSHWPSLHTKEGLEMLLRAVEKYRPDVVFIDTLRGSFTGNENDSDVIRGVFQNLFRIRDMGISVVVADHLGKNATAGARGSSDKGASADITYQLTRVADCEDVVVAKTLYNRFGGTDERHIQLYTYPHLHLAAVEGGAVDPLTEYVNEVKRSGENISQTSFCNGARLKGIKADDKVLRATFQALKSYGNYAGNDRGGTVVEGRSLE